MQNSPAVGDAVDLQPSSTENINVKLGAMDAIAEEIDAIEPKADVEEKEQNDGATCQPGKRSMVWNHFKRLGEETDPNPRAECTWCGTTYACHGKRNGTTAMKTHIKLQCRKYPFSQRNLDKKQKTLGFEPIKGEDGLEIGAKVTIVNFSVEACVKALAEMIILDELPFKFVEGEGFKRFVRVVQPKWKPPGRLVMAKECLKVYQHEKTILKKALKGQRICFTTDTWTSLQNLNYMCLTAHYIDSNWKLHKKILNFCLVPNHKGETLGKVVEECLVDWGIDKILTVTVDNASSNSGLIKFLERKTKERKSTISDHKFLHVRCCAHILNLIVCEGLKDMDTSIMRVRNVVKFVKSSPSRMATFRSCVEKEGITCDLVPCLDVPTRWNSTYFMLERALRYRKAFERLEDENTLFSLSVREDELAEADGVENSGKVSKRTYGTPTSDDWDMVRLYTSVLSLFHDATERFSGSQYVTCNSFFMDMMLIRLEIVRLSEEQENDLLKSFARAMKTKFEKYWKFENVNALLLFGFVLDPRYKFKYVNWCLKKCYEEEVVKQMIVEVKAEMSRFYGWYEKNGCHGLQVQDVGQSSNKRKFLSDENGMASLEKMKFQFKMHLEEEDNLVSKSELERYWMEGCEIDNDQFHLLGWWKANSAKYPILSQVARDILAIPVSTVASESAFSTGGRVLDPYRTSLSPKTAEALICTQDWLRSPTRIRLRDYMDEAEKLEQGLARMGLVFEELLVDMMTTYFCFASAF
ncbi:hypothetical protein RHMOL_Rhmol11G0037400 [Rhododendron molle]|uniref:Uncharacterized protein n=1 Tax=Rhododendron molle TaxID=49168 RepID=A0ACC0LNK7_RHOML|nr:hypothetical protein RHMOL_Rhmol11G0037400 [Rhododendron molle]